MKATPEINVTNENGNVKRKKCSEYTASRMTMKSMTTKISQHSFQKYNEYFLEA